MHYDSNVVVRVIAFTDDDKILSVKDGRKDHPLWNFPGGVREKGESPRECGCREVKEETGVSIAPEDLIFVSTQLFHDRRLVLFVARRAEFSSLKKLGDKGQEVSLIPVRSVRRLKGFVKLYKQMAEKILERIEYGQSLEEAA